MIKTPYFIFYPEIIKKNYRLVLDAMPVDRLYYASKANGETPTLSALIEEDAGFEIVCANEMKLLLSMGVRCSDIICSLPVKTADEISRMYALGCRYFVYDCEEQYDMLCELSPEAKKIARINVRFVSPRDLVHGMSQDEILDMGRRGKLPDGYTFYFFERDDWTIKLDGVFDVIEMLISSRYDDSPLIINLGGHYVLPSAESAHVYKKLRERVSRLRTMRSDLTVIAEPGGCIVDSAYDMVAEVTCIRHDWVFTDTHAGIIRNPYARIEPFGFTRDSDPQVLCFLDSLCSGNVISNQMVNFSPHVGDRIIIRSVGAYSICYASNFHWTGKPQIHTG